MNLPAMLRELGSKYSGEKVKEKVETEWVKEKGGDWESLSLKDQLTLKTLNA